MTGPPHGGALFVGGRFRPNYRLTDLDHVVSMLRIFAEYCQSVNQMAYNMQYYGSHNDEPQSFISFVPDFRVVYVHCVSSTKTQAK